MRATTLATSLFAITLVIGALGSPASAQRLPSPASGFDELLERATAASKAGDEELATRLLWLARSRIVVRPDPYDLGSMTRIFEDMATGAEERAARYLEAIGGFAAPPSPFGPGSAVAAEIAAELAAQAESLVGSGHFMSATFVIEPLYAFDPALALGFAKRIRTPEASKGVSAAAADEDRTTNSALRLAESMSRGTAGGAITSIEQMSAIGKEIADLRRSTSLRLVDVARAALDGGAPWIALDVAAIGPEIYPLYPNQFTEVKKAARAALTKPRAAASKPVVDKLFRSAKKGLAVKSWTIATDAVKFPATKDKAALLVTAKPIAGDFRFAMELDAHFGSCLPGFVMAHAGDDDFYVMSFAFSQKRPLIRIRRVRDGKSEDIHRYDPPEVLAGIAMAKPWPIVIERRGDTWWFRLDDLPWASFTPKSPWKAGAIGLHMEHAVDAKTLASATCLEFESYTTGS
jgi:hypothetical protein